MQVSLTAQAGWVTIQMQDQGAGTPVPCQSDIFEPFYGSIRFTRGAAVAPGWGSPWRDRW
ncbi:MAG TPA: hypothetical protein VEZ50_18815 [Nodosilinea sp.]|nr:hypothetical protein [Nodosilinea sp.]